MSEEGASNSLSFGDSLVHDTFGKFIVVMDFHNMQVLWLVPTQIQQTKNFLSDPRANMDAKEEKQFQLAVLTKKKNKLKQHQSQSHSSKGFKICTSNCSPH